MPYIPSILNYHPFYIQNGSESSAWDTRDYGLVAQAQPYPDNYEAKDPYKNDWFDEDGDDEYVAPLKRKAFEYTVKFYIRDASFDAINTYKEAFRAKITQGEIKIYDSWQGRGFQHVRFVKDNVDQREEEKDYVWMIFSATFKVNDPSTKMTLSGGAIVTA